MGGGVVFLGVVNRNFELRGLIEGKNWMKGVGRDASAKHSRVAEWESGIGIK